MDNIWQEFIHPKRNTFTPDQLGPTTRRIDADTVFDRFDGAVRNTRTNLLHYNFFRLRESPKYHHPKQTCLIYLHSHGGNRIEGFNLIRYAGLLGLNICFFDFACHGMSEGTYCSLGFRESEDCEAVVQELMKVHFQEKFVLWGRSMGANAAIVYATRHRSNLDYLILDSPFSSVDQIIRDYGARFVKVGEYVAVIMFDMVKDEINYKTGCDLANFRPIDFCTHLEVPCVFMVGKDDDLVLPERVDEMFRSYKSVQRHLILIEGTHSSARSSLDLDRILEYLELYYKMDLRSVHNARQRAPQFSNRGLNGRPSYFGLNSYQQDHQRQTQEGSRRMERPSQLINSLSNLQLSAMETQGSKIANDTFKGGRRESQKEMFRGGQYPKEAVKKKLGFVDQKLLDLNQQLKNLAEKSSAPGPKHSLPQSLPSQKLAERAMQDHQFGIGPTYSSMTENIFSLGESQGKYDASRYSQTREQINLSQNSTFQNSPDLNHSISKINSPVPVRVSQVDPFLNHTSTSPFKQELVSRLAYTNHGISNTSTPKGAHSYAVLPRDIHSAYNSPNKPNWNGYPGGTASMVEDSSTKYANRQSNRVDAGNTRLFGRSDTDSRKNVTDSHSKTHSFRVPGQQPVIVMNPNVVNSSQDAIGKYAQMAQRPRMPREQSATRVRKIFDEEDQTQDLMASINNAAKSISKQDAGGGIYRHLQLYRTNSRQNIDLRPKIHK